MAIEACVSTSSCESRINIKTAGVFIFSHDLLVGKGGKIIFKKKPILNSCEWQNIYGHNSRKITTPNYFGYHKKKYKTRVNTATTNTKKLNVIYRTIAKKLVKMRLAAELLNRTPKRWRKQKNNNGIFEISRDASRKDEMKCRKLEFSFSFFFRPFEHHSYLIWYHGGKQMISKYQIIIIITRTTHITCTPYQNYYQILLSCIRWWVGG